MHALSDSLRRNPARTAQRAIPTNLDIALQGSRIMPLTEVVRNGFSSARMGCVCSQEWVTPLLYSRKKQCDFYVRDAGIALQSPVN
jgi:hypothetical protein